MVPVIFSLNPPHHVCPPRFSELAFSLSAHGYVPIVTHPERLSWIGDHYELLVDLALKGVWMQVTAGSLTGSFGRGARYWGERMLDKGLVHLLATDAHGVERRPPLLGEGVAAVEKWVSSEEVQLLVQDRPRAVLADQAPDSMPLPPALREGYPARKKSRGKLSQMVRICRSSLLMSDNRCFIQLRDLTRGSSNVHVRLQRQAEVVVIPISCNFALYRLSINNHL